MALIGCLLVASVIVTAALIGGYNIDVNLTNSVANMDHRQVCGKNIFLNNRSKHVASLFVGFEFLFTLITAFKGSMLTLKVLVMTIDAQWEGMGM